MTTGCPVRPKHREPSATHFSLPLDGPLHSTTLAPAGAETSRPTTASTKKHTEEVVGPLETRPARPTGINPTRRTQQLRYVQRTQARTVDTKRGTRGTGNGKTEKSQVFSFLNGNMYKTRRHYSRKNAKGRLGGEPQETDPTGSSKGEGGMDDEPGVLITAASWNSESVGGDFRRGSRRRTGGFGRASVPDTAAACSSSASELPAESKAPTAPLPPPPAGTR